MPTPERRTTCDPAVSRPTTGQSESRFVTCSCQHCGEHIQFDVNQIDEGDTRLAPCPHCGEETLVHDSPQRVPPVIPPTSPRAATENDSTEDNQEVNSQVMRWYRKAAELGDAFYQYEFGQLQAGGFGVQQDWVEAADWFRKSAEQGNADAQFNLGTCYWNGQGVAQDRIEAVKWLRKAADQGDQSGQYGLGVAYSTGDGVLQDHAEAALLFRKAAEQGHATAQFNLSVLYGKGEGLGKDLVEAYKWGSLAAAQNVSRAEAQCLELASEMNSDELQESLRRIEAFQNNFRPAAARPERPFLDLLRKFAETGDIEAQQLLVLCCGDKIEATKWIRRSAQQGSSLAQHRLGLAYRDGEGVPQDYVQAVEWFRKAALQGSVLAQVDLAAAYFVGVGVPQNYVEAYRLLNIAASKGNEEAMELRKTVALEMTPKQIAHAQRLSSENREQSPGRQPIPSDVRREVWRRDEGRCVKCGSREKLEYDHIIPVAKGGSNTVRNLELLCESCNRAKSAAIQ